MELEKNKLTIIIILSATIIIMIIGFSMLALKQNQQLKIWENEIAPINQVDNELTNVPSNKQRSVNDLEVDVSAIKNIKATLLSADIGAIVIKTDEENELTLNIPEKGASFYEQTKINEEEYLMEEMSLSDLPIDQEVSIQYNDITNELLLLVVE